MMSRTRRYTLLVSPPPQHPLEPLSEVADSLDVTLWGHRIGSGNGVHLDHLERAASAVRAFALTAWDSSFLGGSHRPSMTTARR
jgi:hypothetical protein